jgi:ribosomal protein S16
MKQDRLEHWTKQGAQLSDTVKRLLKNMPAPAALPVA